MVKKYKQTLPYGEWPSPINPELFANMLKLSEPCWLRDGSLVWRERSSGLTCLQRIILRTKELQTISGELDIGGDLLYGGGSITSTGEHLYGFDKKSHQLFRIGTDSLEQLTTDLSHAASPRLSSDQKYAIFVHSTGEDDAIYIKDTTNTSAATVLVEGSDFYNYPRWSPDDTKIAWISWNHPHLPWDRSELWLGELVNNDSEPPSIISRHLVAGGAGISVLQPEFTPDGKTLVYVSDIDGWWQIFTYDIYSGKQTQITAENADHGLPPWLQDQKSYLITPDSKKILFLRNKKGIRSLWEYDLDNDLTCEIILDRPYTWLEDPVLDPSGKQIAMIASGATTPSKLIITSLEGSTEIIRDSSPEPLPEEYFTNPQPISWSGLDGGSVHGLYYPPTHPEIDGSGVPPLLVIIHSGPTRQKWIDFQTRTQFFTSRGIAVLEVNYRGSTGYGRAYWEALRGKWGLLDVDDCYSGALYCADQGLADPDRMAVLGSSSGGLAVYQSLIKYPGFFQGAISLYGIVNHLSLLESPPKFERYYSEWLIGPYPETADRYKERSPIFSADQIRDPVAIFQGGKDRIVPPDQADQITAELKKNQVDYLYRLYPDEGHSFKRIDTLVDFYSCIEDFMKEYVI